MNKSVLTMGCCKPNVLNTPQHKAKKSYEHLNTVWNSKTCLVRPVISNHLSWTTAFLDTDHFWFKCTCQTRPVTTHTVHATSDHTANTGAITTNSNAITANTNAITANTGAITANTNAITANTGAITADSSAITADTGADLILTMMNIIHYLLVTQCVCTLSSLVLNVKVFPLLY